MLLNAVLTVRAHEANSHKDRGWETFTDAVIRALAARPDPMVFLLWGAYAQKKAKLIDANRDVILTAAHPSPLSAAKFFGSKPFSAANKALEAMGKEPIDWQISDLESGFYNPSRRMSGTRAYRDNPASSLPRQPARRAGRWRSSRRSCTPCRRRCRGGRLNAAAPELWCAGSGRGRPLLRVRWYEIRPVQPRLRRQRTVVADQRRRHHPLPLHEPEHAVDPSPRVPACEQHVSRARPSAAPGRTPR